MKLCTKCNTQKPLSEYSMNNGKPRSYCKACAKIMKKSWSEKNKAKVSAYNKEYHAKHSEERCKAQRRWAKSNPDKVKAYNKQYGSKYYEANKEVILAAQAEYRANNLEQIRAQQREYQKLNLHKFREANRRRRAAKNGVNENYTALDASTTLAWFGNQCAKCGSTDSLCIDHHLPLSKGNALSLSNAVVLCSTCNCSKGSKLPEEFYSISQLVGIETMLSLISDEYCRATTSA